MSPSLSRARIVQGQLGIGARDGAITAMMLGSLSARSSVSGSRQTSIFGWWPDLKPSAKIMSASSILATRSGSESCVSFCSSRIRAHRVSEATITSLAPASRCLKLSLPGLSMSKAWWACFTVETLNPSAVKCFTNSTTRVVLPLFCQPMTPMTLFISAM